MAVANVVRADAADYSADDEAAWDVRELRRARAAGPV